MSEKGFFKVDRDLFEHWLWKDKPFCQGAAWIDLIGLANHKTIKAVKNGKIVTYKRGTVHRSILELASRWGWERKKVRRFLSVLELDKMVVVNGSRHGTTITLLNYGKFQNIGATKWATDGTRDGQPMGHELPINKNEKNEKNEKNVYGAAAHTFPPTLSEVSDYIEERGLRVTAEKFWRYYEAKEWTLANGRRMTRTADWHGALESWKEESEVEEVEQVRNPRQREGYGAVEAEYFGTSG